MTSPARLLLGDMRMKLLAVLLAWGVWVIAREDVEAEEQRTLEVDVQPEGADLFQAELVGETVGSRPVSSVSVVLKGPRAAIDRFRAIPNPKVVARVTPAVLKGKDASPLTLKVEDLEFPPPIGSELRLVSWKPDTIKLTVYWEEERSLPLARIEIEGRDEFPYVELEAWSQRAEVRVRGRRDVLKQTALHTAISKQSIQDALDRMGKKNRDTVVLPLRVVGGDALVLVGVSGGLKANVRIVRRTPRELSLPLHIHYTSDGTSDPVPRRLAFAAANETSPYYQAGSPPTVTVKIRGAPDVVNQIDPGTVEAYVMAADMDETATGDKVPLRLLGLPDGVEVDQPAGGGYQITLQVR